MASSIYAESLLNLRQVTVCISLPSEADTSTTLSLSANNTVLEVHHQSHTASLELPAAVSSASSPKVPPHAKQDISLRLPFATEEPHAGPCSGQESTSAWSAQALADVEELACQACGAPWISSGPIKDWKDLPNEDWAEMMELWHCHKPHVPHAQNGDGTGGTKGYAAANKLTAQPGVGLVGVSSVLVSPEDCSGIELLATRNVEDTSQQQQQALQCKTCHAEIGYLDDRALGWKLYAWSMSGRRATEDQPVSWPLETSFSAYLLALIDNQATTKFIVRSNTEASDHSGLLLWVFNPDIYYSSSLDAEGPKRAMKVFYQRVAEASKFSERLDQAVEDVYLPTQAVDRLMKSLDRTNVLLPAAARRLQAWHVALIERSDAPIRADTEPNQR